MARMELSDTAEVRRLLKEIPPLPATQEGLAALQQVVDRAVRASRDQYWCERLEAALEATIPQMKAADGHFYATDDLDCRKKKIGVGAAAFNEMGYNSDGVDRDGWDRRGNPPYDEKAGRRFMPDGFTRSYDRDGYDALGISEDGHDKNGSRRKGRGPTPEEEELANGMVNPTTAVLGPDGKLYKQGTVFDTPAATEVQTSPPVKVAKKAAPRKVAVGATADLFTLGEIMTNQPASAGRGM